MASVSEIDLRDAVVVRSDGLPAREKKAVAMLIDEVEKRTHLMWPCAATWPNTGQPVIAIGDPSALASFGGRVRVAGDLKAAEGFHIRSDAGKQTISVIGNDERGVLYGVGWMLRNLFMEPGIATAPDALGVDSVPRYRLRGHQIGYRDKVNSYDGWDLPQWEQYIRDLAVFGANAVEMIPPRSDDRPTSVHFPRPPLEMMSGISRIADEYGIDVWLWYPALDVDYADPGTVQFALAEWADVFKALPRLNAILVPGGDPGRTPPRLLFPMLAKQAAQLATIHPGVEWWVSPQGFSKEGMDDFLSILRNDSLPWLTGVVHAPWVHMHMSEFRKQVPAKYAIRNYPDITHTLSCQYPVPDWDIALALTTGREPVNPRPVDESIIFHESQPGTIGFVCYCEGCHDDVNKAVWSSLGWDPDRSLVDILREYGRHFIGERYADDWAQGLLALERNWRGPLAANTGVCSTLQQFQTMEERAGPWTLKNWRFLQGLYRAYYDAYVRSRLLYESSLEEQAMDRLRGAAGMGSLVALSEAERIIDLAVTQRIAAGWRTRVFQLAEALYQSPAHMQLSVQRYRGQEEVRGANLDGIDFPLNNRPWLKERFAAIRQMAAEDERLAAIRQILEWTNPGPGGFYDDLGSSLAQPHVVKGPGYEHDPAFLDSPQHRYPYRKDRQPIRLSWRGFTGALNDNPFRMHYPDIDPSARYRVRLVYSDLDLAVKVHLDANGIEVHPWMLKPIQRQPLEFDIPPEATQQGSVTLTWQREPGLGHSGVGCDISEVWLIKC